MAYVNLNVLYDCEFGVPLDTDGNEVRNLDGWNMIDSMSSYNLRDKLENQTVVMFSVIGTFRDNIRINEFNTYVDDLKAAGADRVICHIVADPYQTYAWAAHLNMPGIEFIADGNGYLALRMGMLFHATNEDSNLRVWGYDAVIENGIATYWNQLPGLPLDDPDENINLGVVTHDVAPVLSFLQAT